MRSRALGAVVVAVTSLVLWPASPAAGTERLSPLITGLDTPLFATAPPFDNRVFVAERGGDVLVWTSSEEPLATFATLPVGTAGEGGLLGLAFSPNYRTDGHLYVSYTDTSGDSRVDRLTVSEDRDRADPGSRVNILTVPQPYSNHNGGMIAFAEDGMLLVALGDGGGAGDPDENGQDTTTLLGSLLRLDVLGRAGGGYAVPPDNPFVGRAGRDEIWVYGLRNPWRFDVDDVTGDVWIGDVGQGRVEEATRVPYEPSRAFNLGWDRWEGSECFESCGSTTGLTFPDVEYGHTGGACSITGGPFVRDANTAGHLDDRYLYSDFCAGWFEVYDPANGHTRRLDIAPVGNVFSFGESAFGDVFVLTNDTVWELLGTGTAFLDVPVASVFASSIDAMAARDITRGCDPPDRVRYCPHDPVTREQMAAFLLRAFDLRATGEPFVDVPDGDPFAGAIGALAEAGITSGCNPPTNDRFCPDRAITRAEMAVFLQRVLGLPSATPSFVDVPADDPFAPAIGAIAEVGVTIGCDPPANDRFCPHDPVTRQQMAAFIIRSLRV